MTKRPSDEKSADTGATSGRRSTGVRRSVQSTRRRVEQDEPAVGKHAKSEQPADADKKTGAVVKTVDTKTASTQSAGADTKAISTQPVGADANSDKQKAKWAEWPDPGEQPDENGLYRRRHSIRHKKRKRRVKIAVIAALVLVLLIVGTAAGVWYLIVSGEQLVRESAQAEDLETAEDAVTYDDGLTVVYNGTTYRYNENIVSIVVMGYDRTDDVSVTGAAGQADAVMVVAMDTLTGEISVIGIPRDSMVYVDEMVGSAFVGEEEMQLALAYSYGDGYETSAENVVRAVKRILYNMPMNYYVALSMDGIGALNDAVGGITLTAIETIPNSAIVEGTTITLYGTNAVRYVQYRDITQLDSALQRQARQTQYLRAFFSQAISNAAGNPAVLVSLYQSALEYATTNLGVQELAYLATVLLQNGMSELEVTTLAGEAVMGDEYVEYYLDEESVYQTVLDVFYTVVEDADTDSTNTGTDTITDTSMIE